MNKNEIEAKLTTLKEEQQMIRKEFEQKIQELESQKIQLIVFYNQKFGEYSGKISQLNELLQEETKNESIQK